MNLSLLKKARVALNITQEEMAEKLGYKDKSSYCQIENGKAQLPLSKIKTVKDILKLSEEKFTQIFLT